jgi:hypothetical protein
MDMIMNHCRLQFIHGIPGAKHVCSVPFSKGHKYILVHTKEMLECRNGHMSNHPGHCKVDLCFEDCG